MKNKHKVIYKVMVLLVIFIFLFPKNILADEWEKGDNVYYYTLDEDDGTGGKDVKEIDWKIFGFTKETLDSGVDISTFEIDEKYGWCTVKEDTGNGDGTSWVVLRSMYT